MKSALVVAVLLSRVGLVSLAVYCGWWGHYWLATLCVVAAFSMDVKVTT